MAKILLTTINAKWIHPSLALRLLKANLGALESQAQILEFALRQPLLEKTSAILEANPKILAFSVSIWNHLGTLEILKALEEVWNSAPDRGKQKPFIVLGGPEVSHLPASAELIKHADWVVAGEGELVFADLCQSLLNDQSVQTLPHTDKIEGKFIYAKPVPLSKIDPGYRLYTEEDLHRKLCYVEASRGCPFGCDFCLSSLETKVREFPLEAFLHNMELLIDAGARSFKFLDRTFNLDIVRAQTIMDFFLKRLCDSMYVHFEMVPSRFPEALRERLKSFPPGSLRLEVGIQTFNPVTAKLIKRPSNPDKEVEALGFLRDSTHAIVHADLIAGLPGEDSTSFAQGFNRLYAAGPGEIQLGILKQLPGTGICRLRETYGMVYSKLPPYEVLETAVLSRADLDRIKNFARFWELIVNRGHFDDLVPTLLSGGNDTFSLFMKLSDALLERFGKNWGIARNDLRTALEEYSEQL